MTDPSAAASPSAVRAAALRLALASGLSAPARVLDVPCGTGELLDEFVRRGFDALGGDRDPSVARSRGLRADALDLERPLPYRDGEFALALCVEGIEHVEAQAPLIGELARVLAPGGALVLTTPNVLGRPSRTSMRRHGYARFFRPEAAGAATPFEHEHTHPIDAVRLVHLLARAGLEPVAFDCERGPDGAPSLRRRVMRALEAPRLRRHNPRADLLLLPPLYYGRVLALRARKGGSPS